MPYKKYKCRCGHEWKQWAYYSQGETSVLDNRKGKKSSCSTQIKCPNCLTFIPTWDVRYVDDGYGGKKKIKIRK